MQKTRESTGFATSGLHYGHYIAGAESDFLANINLIFMQLPFQLGFHLSRWENSVHCMLQKELLPFLHRLQIIQLYEADFNIYMKMVFGRKLSNHAEAHHIIGDESHGNRPHRSTHDALLTSRLISDSARLYRRPILVATTDLCGCYDRIPRKLNTITTRREGTPAPVAISHAKTLRHMKHRIRTSSGLSPEFIISSKSQPLEGLGQDNGGGPKGFMTVETVISIMYSKITKAGITISSPDKSKSVCIQKISYFDDN